MLEEIKTKSKVISFCDFKDIDISEIIGPYKTDDEQIMQDIMLIRKQHAAIVESTEVEKDCFVTLSCKSETPKFNKEKITVKVGKGLFSKELEEQLIGMKPDESRSVTVGSDSVTVHILKIEKSELPELTDENVCLWNIDGAKSVDELKSILASRQHEAYINDVSEALTAEIMKRVNQRSVFELDDTEMEQVDADGRKFAFEMIRSSGIDPNSASEEEVKEAIGRTASEHIKFVEDLFRDSFRSSLIGAELVRQNHVVFTDDDYEKALQEQMKFMDTSEEEARKDFTFEKFLKQAINDYHFELVEKYAKEYLRKESE